MSNEKVKAKYQVTVAPGAPVPGVGFVPVGSVFEAPSEDYTPSRTFRAANDEAKGPLEKVYASEKTRLEATKNATEESPIDRQIAQLEAEKQERLKVVEPPKEPPKIEPGMSLAELDEINRKPDHAPAHDAPPHDQPPKQGGHPPKGGRASDK